MENQAHFEVGSSSEESPRKKSAWVCAGQFCQTANSVNLGCDGDVKLCYAELQGNWTGYVSFQSSKVGVQMRISSRRFTLLLSEAFAGVTDLQGTIELPSVKQVQLLVQPGAGQQSMALQLQGIFALEGKTWTAALTFPPAPPATSFLQPDAYLMVLQPKGSDLSTQTPVASSAPSRPAGSTRTPSQAASSAAPSSAGGSAAPSAGTGSSRKPTATPTAAATPAPRRDSCGNGCSGHGECQEVLCFCQSGWYGSLCDRSGVAGVTVPRRQELPPRRWSVVKPGGDTSCLYGDDYAFMVRPGPESAVVVEFEDSVYSSGSASFACWNAETCSAASKGGARTTPYPARFPENLVSWPTSDASYIFVPLCTLDLHLGMAAQLAPNGSANRSLFFLGGRNVRAVFAWVNENYANATSVTVIGSGVGIPVATSLTSQFLSWPSAPYVRLIANGPLVPRSAEWLPLVANLWRLPSERVLDLGTALGVGAACSKVPKIVASRLSIAVITSMADAWQAAFSRTSALPSVSLAPAMMANYSAAAAMQAALASLVKVCESSSVGLSFFASEGANLPLPGALQHTKVRGAS